MDDCEWEESNFENAYFNWLVTVMHASHYTILLEVMNDTEYEWPASIPRESDRAEDGKELRKRFSSSSGMHVPPSITDKPCSFLEFVAALAFAIDDDIMYDADNPDQVSEWFWLMMSNLGFDEFTDESMTAGGMVAHMEVTEKMDMVMKRRYDYNGYPGMFPLRKPQMDQKKVETWYQANAYFIEEYFE